MFRKLVLVTVLAGAASPAWSIGASKELSDLLADSSPVESFSLLGYTDGWRAIDDRNLVLHISPSRSYLISLRTRSPELRFAHTIALTSTAGRVSGRFDEVIVRGQRYPIASIRALDPRPEKDPDSTESAS